MAVTLEVLSRGDVELFLDGGGDPVLRAAASDYLRGALDELSQSAFVPSSAGPVAANGNGKAGLHWAHQLLEALPAAVYTTDADGRITYYNEAAADLWGRSPELGDDQWCGSWRLYWPDGRPMPHDECPMAVALREGREARGVEAVAERPDGTRVPFIPYPTLLRDSSGAVVGAVNMLVDITERKVAETALREREARLELLVREVDHRAKNVLTIVQAVARRTQADTVPGFVEILMGRLHALARAHTLLAEALWAGADLKRLVEQELAAYGTGRVTISGAPHALGPESAQPVAMALHELATNAAKYGALSVPHGRVAIEWLRSPPGQLLIRWTESGGPPVRQPARRGFGFELIEALSEQLGGTAGFDWRPQGLVCEMAIAAGLPKTDREAAE